MSILTATCYFTGTGKFPRGTVVTSVASQSKMHVNYLHRYVHECYPRLLIQLAI